MSQQNVKHALSVDTLQHTLEEVIRHHGSGASSERREVRDRRIKMNTDYIGNNGDEVNQSTKHSLLLMHYFSLNHSMGSSWRMVRISPEH